MRSNQLSYPAILSPFSTTTLNTLSGESGYKSTAYFCMGKIFFEKKSPKQPFCIDFAFKYSVLTILIAFKYSVLTILIAHISGVLTMLNAHIFGVLTILITYINTV